MISNKGGPLGIHGAMLRYVTTVVRCGFTFHRVTRPIRAPIYRLLHRTRTSPAMARESGVMGVKRAKSNRSKTTTQKKRVRTAVSFAVVTIVGELCAIPTLPPESVISSSPRVALYLPRTWYCTPMEAPGRADVQ